MNKKVIFIAVIIIGCFFSIAGLQDMDTHWARLDDYNFRIYPTDGWQIHKTETDTVVIKNRNLSLTAELTIVVYPINIAAFDYLVTGADPDSYDYREVWRRKDDLLDNFRHAFTMYKDVKFTTKGSTNWSGNYTYDNKTYYNYLAPIIYYDFEGMKFDKSTWQKYHGRVYMMCRNRHMYYYLIDCPSDEDYMPILSSLKTTLDAEHIRLTYDQEYVANSKWNYSIYVPLSWERQTNNMDPFNFVHESGAHFTIRSGISFSGPNIASISSNDTVRMKDYVDQMRAIDIRGWKKQDGVELIKEKTIATRINGLPAIYDMAKYSNGDKVFDEYNIYITDRGNTSFHIIISRERLPDEPPPISYPLRIERRAGRHIEEMVGSFATY